MQINYLELENFQGIAKQRYRFNGGDTDIYGDNGSGKTTIANAWFWLLADRPSTGTVKFSPKPRDEQGERHNLETRVAAEIATDSGQTVTLSKSLKEVWKKKRGFAIAEFTGHTVDYAIDRVPVKEKEYTDYLNRSLGGMDKLLLLSYPGYFAEGLGWEQRRGLLLDMLGEIDEAAVIAADQSLSGLPDLLKGRSVEDYSKIAKSGKTEINKRLQNIPARIDELSNLASVNTDYESLRAELAKLPDVVDLMQELAKAKAKAEQAKAAYIGEINRANSETAQKIAALQDPLAQAETAAQKLKSNIAAMGFELERLETKRSKLLVEFAVVQNETWDNDQEICPTCKRILPPEQVEAARKKFAAEKAKRIDQINAEGKQYCSKEAIGLLQERRDKAETDCAAATEKAIGLEAEREKLYNQIQRTILWENTEEAKGYGILCQQIQAAIQEDIGQKRRVELESLLAMEQSGKAAKERINALSAEEKELAAQYEDLEQGLFLCENFTRAKAARLEETVNRHFDQVRFKLFTEQLNGGIKDDCEIILPAIGGCYVPYRMANRAAQINADLEIINVFSRWQGMTLPVFVDNAEAVTELAKTEGQLIRLIVSAQDKQLRIVQTEDK